MDEYFPHVFERVFVHGRILASCFRQGIRPTDEYLPHVFERVFVRRRILVSQTEHEANEYECSYSCGVCNFASCVVHQIEDLRGITYHTSGNRTYFEV